MSRQSFHPSFDIPSSSTTHGRTTPGDTPSHPSQEGSSTLRTRRAKISFRVHDRNSTLTDVSETEKIVGFLSPSLLSSKIVNTFSTAKFLCATVVELEKDCGPVSPDRGWPLLPIGNKRRMETVGTVFSRSTILSPTKIASSRLNSGRNVRVLELPISKRLSVPFGDVPSSTNRRSGSDADCGFFIRRVNSDVIWDDVPQMSVRKTSKDDDSSRYAVTIRGISSTRAQARITSSRSSTSRPSVPHVFDSKALRRRPVIPALDQMAHDLRAGWMGEDDVEEELQDLNLFNPLANTKMNRTGEEISNFFIGSSIVSNFDIDYFCGIVPASTVGIVTKVVNWRMFVKWKLKNFEKYRECEVCGSEVSLSTDDIPRIKRKGTIVRMENKQATKVGFDLESTQFIEPDPRALEDFEGDTMPDASAAKI